MYIPIWALVLLATFIAAASFYLGMGFMACLMLAGSCNGAERRGVREWDA